MNKAEATIQQLKEAFNLDKFSFSFTCSMYIAGDGNKQLRKDIMYILTGAEMPATKCNFNRVVDTMSNSFVKISLF